MGWWEYRLARGAGYSRWDAFRSAFLNHRLPSRKAEIDAEREATIARMEAIDPELVAKLRREGKL
jgi:hypothetical protein